MEIKFTPRLWQRILGFTVMDPDGWDRKGDFATDWERPLTFTEFMDKADESTCSRHPKREILRQMVLRRFKPNFPDSTEEVDKMLV